MNRIRASLSRALVGALLLSGSAAVCASREASAQYVAPPIPPQYVAPPPPSDAYVATTAPEYYEGRPVYLYNNSWYFRDQNGAWNYYRTEPAYLRDRRAHGDDRNHSRYRYRR